MTSSSQRHKQDSNTSTSRHDSQQPASEQPVQQTVASTIQRAQVDSGSLTPGDVRTLQRTVGNRATRRLLRPVLQRKDLTLGPADDQYEQEADRVAEQVVRQIDSAAAPARRQPTVRRDDLEEEEVAQAKPLAERLTPVRQPSPAKRTFQKIQHDPFAQRDAEEQPTHGLAGGAVEQSVQQRIRAAGSGKSLDEGVRRQMEKGFGADFSNVRIHSGSQADTLNRSLNARAFTVGRDVFFKRGEYNPGSRAGKKLLAHELTHTVQQGGAHSVQKKPVVTGGQRLDDAVVQRAVGFEFQTNWGVTEKKQGWLGSSREKLPKGAVLHAYPGFNLTADEAGTELGAEIEWVVDPPIDERAGVKTLSGIMKKLEVVVSWLVALQNRDTFTLDEATDDPRDAWVEVHPNIKGAGNAQNMKSNPQMTGGVRLEQMATMFAQLGDLNADGGEHREARSTLMGMGGAGLIGMAATRAQTIQGSDKLKGLAAQIIAYLKAGALPHWQQPSPGQAYDYAKLIGKIMARTDFGSQFNMLDDAERQTYEGNPTRFVNAILDAADLRGSDDVHVFQRGIKNVPGDRDKGMFNFPVSRKDWLVGITQGRDRLSSKHMPQWKSELEGLGALGGKTDTVGTNAQKGMILEFRSMQQQIPYKEWRSYAERLFSYLIYLNAMKSPDEQRQAVQEQRQIDDAHKARSMNFWG